MKGDIFAMENKMNDFIKITEGEKVALIDPIGKVCLGVSKRFADNLDKPEFQEKLYPVWKQQTEFIKKIENNHEKINGTFPKISTQSLRIMKLLHRKQGKIFTKSNEYYVRKISCAWGMPGFRIHSFRDYRRKIEMGITAGVQVPRIIPL